MGEGIMWGKKRVTGFMNWEHWDHMVSMRMTVFMLKTNSLGYAHARAKRIVFVVFCLMSRRFNTTIWILLYDACNSFSVTLKKSAKCSRNMCQTKRKCLSSWIFDNGITKWTFCVQQFFSAKVAIIKTKIDYEQSLFFLGPSSKTCAIRKWPRAWLKAGDSSRAAALVSRLPRLRRSTLALACTPRTKSEEKARLLAV